METFQLTVKTLEGLEEVLAREIQEIGGSDIVKGLRAVHFSGDTAMIYRANYRLRTALRIFKQIDTFKFSNMDDFYVKCMKIRWELFMNLNDSFVIQSTVMQSELFKNSMFASLKLKDAIADRFRQRTGSRPSVDTADPDIIFHIHIAGNNCTISIDSSGESLHKRGYRQSQGEAPLNEVLAAGMLMLAGWKGDSDFYDPMCGSGTLPIEAGLIARNIPPGKFRKGYAFMSWKDFDRDLFDTIREEAEPAEFNFHIYAGDINASSVLTSKTNARNARVFNLITFLPGDFSKTELKLEGALLMMNPPYGERIHLDTSGVLYEKIGEKLKHHFMGNTAWILSSSAEHFHKIGLKPSSKIKLFNGALECSFQKFELFEGKRKLLVRKT
ncbi:MAG TPA: class I SAM-dependent RNA methyltransferase [Prolixibacteraceae bacterium]|nr:class I SAM-dependent RNA methyltransferase [Prolixibacteraceae bacterium]